MDIIEARASDRERYDAAVAASPLADVMQSFAWGEVKRSTGWAPLRLIAIDADGRARGACSVLRKVPARGVAPLLYMPRGPVVDFADAEALHGLVGAIRARAGSAFMLKCDPPIEAGSTAERALVSAGFQRVSSGPFGGRQPTAVMELDLSPGADKIFEGFKSKWRYNIRLASRKGVTVREGTTADLDAFHSLYRETAARDGFTGWGRSYFDTLFRELGPAGMIDLWVAEHDGVVLAGIVVMTMGDRAIYVFGASGNAQRNLMPNHLLQWTAIQAACERGLKVYDFRGVSPVRDGEPIEPHIAGLNRFKEGFGARYVEYAGEFDLPLRAGWYRAWRYGAPMAFAARARIRGGTPAD